MEIANRIEENSMAQKATDGKDEMNLAEFPLCALSRRLRPDQKTLRFEDRVLDKGRGEWITRQLTITGSDAYGLPTALDDEVLLGLIQLTRQYDFANRKVPFTRHALLRLLDWRDDTKNYRRLETSLNRWMGVTLYYQRAWWNNAKKCWMDEKFHILDNVWLCRRGDVPPDTGIDSTGAPLSAFLWNEVIFRSFQAGNLKSIDFDFFKSLNSAVAKRLYRFLDKRFWHRDRCEFNLRELACQHLGLAQGYDTANLKRKLQHGIHELESRGFIRCEPARFRKVRSGDWQICFQRGKDLQTFAPQKNSQQPPAVQQELISRGVSPAMAAHLSGSHSEDAIRSQIEVFDWLAGQKDGRVSRNPAGFLVSAIRHGYTQPRSFTPVGARARPEAVNLGRTEPSPESRRESPRRQQEQTARQASISKFWSALAPEERAKLEAEAIAVAPKFNRGLIENGGVLGNVARKQILDEFAVQMMRNRS